MIITPIMYETAKWRAEELGKLNNSIRQGRGNLAGLLGEEIVIETLPNSHRQMSYDYDITYQGMRIEVKTKDRTVFPRPEYEVSISGYNSTQNCDLYVFVSLLRRGDTYTDGWIVGSLTPTEFYDKARKVSKGCIDPTNNWRAKCDCYNLPISYLRGLV